MTARSDGRQRLTQHMEGRQAELRLTWADVAQRGDISVALLRRIRNGGARLTAKSKVAIEVGLDWPRGTVDAILAGHEPAALSRSTELSDDVVLAKIRRAIELIPRVRQRDGDEAADALLVGLNVDPKVRRLIELIPGLRQKSESDAAAMVELAADAIMEARERMIHGTNAPYTRSEAK
jgi:hypothetical protein